MKLILALVASLTLTAGTAFAGGEMKEVCKDKMDKAGKVVMGKDGKAVQVCKTIKVHKKLEGTEIPPAPSKK
jgi:hypothetical protein